MRKPSHSRTSAQTRAANNNEPACGSGDQEYDDLRFGCSPGVVVDRRDFLKTASLSALAASVPLGADAFARSVASPASVASTSIGAVTKADYSLHIATGVLELSPKRFVSTTLYNGDFPGPLLGVLKLLLCQVARCSHP